MAVIGCSFAGRSGFLKMEIHSIRCMSSSVSACDRAWKKWSNISDTSFIGWILQDSPQSMPKSKRYGHTWQSHVKIGRAYVKIDVGIDTVKTFLSPKLVHLILNDRRRVWLTTPLLIPWCHKDQTCRKKYQHLMFKTYDLCNSCAYVNRIWACLIWLHVVIVESTKLPSDALPLLSWWPWGANPIVSRQDLVDDGGSWEHDDISWDDGNMLCFSCLKHHLCHMSWCFQICAFIFKRIWWWSQLIYI